MSDNTGWAVCTYRGTLLEVFESYAEAHDWVGLQLSTADYYIRKATKEDKKS